MSQTPVHLGTVLDKSPAGGGSSASTNVPTRAAATLAAGYPITIPTSATPTDLTNADCTVVSDGITPIDLYAQAAFANSGVNVGKLILEIREGATVIVSSGQADVAVSPGNSVIDLADTVILSAGTHLLKLSARKVGANGAITVTSGSGDGADTYLHALMLNGTGALTPSSWSPVSGGAGLIWQGADSLPHVLPGLDVADVTYSRAVGGKIIGQTYDRAGIRGAIPSAVAWVSGWTAGGVFLCEETATLANVYTWLALAANWTGATNPVCKAGIYGPITLANAAAVPLLAGSLHTTTAVTTAGYARSSGWPLAASLLRGSLYCLVAHMSWTVAPTTIPNFNIHNASGALSANNDPAQGAANLGTIALTYLQTGLLDLPATIDLSNARTVNSATRLPLLIACTV